jgi:TolA-binding protein
MVPNGVVSPAATATAAESELSQQVRDYRQAVEAMHSNPKLALDKLLTYRSKWRHSAIAQEVDLRVIEALTALGRHHEAANAARSFVQNYPDSSHSVQMRRIADAAPVPNG